MTNFETIIEQLDKKGIKQKSIAAKIGISEQTLSQARKGARLKNRDLYADRIRVAYAYELQQVEILETNYTRRQKIDMMMSEIHLLLAKISKAVLETA